MRAWSSLRSQDFCVILVSLDGFAHFYVDDPLTHMPTLRRMIREGVVADRGMECSFPTVTWPNHTTLVTGVPPAKHGVLANMVFDREKGVTQNKKRDGTHGYLPHHPDMRGIFIAWGRGIKPGTKLRLIHNTQVAPTMARLLGLEFPSATGKPLTASLAPAAN